MSRSGFTVWGLASSLRKPTKFCPFFFLLSRLSPSLPFVLFSHFVGFLNSWNSNHPLCYELIWKFFLYPSLKPMNTLTKVKGVYFQSSGFLCQHREPFPMDLSEGGMLWWLHFTFLLELWSGQLFSTEWTEGHKTPNLQGLFLVYSWAGWRISVPFVPHLTKSPSTVLPFLSQILQELICTLLFSYAVLTI